MTDPTYITCRELIEFIVDYRDGTLPTESVREFDRHLRACPSCVAYLAGYEQTVAAIALQREPSPPLEAAPEALVRAIRAARAKQA